MISVGIQQTVRPQSEQSIMWWRYGPPGGVHMVEEIPGPELHHYRGWKQCQYLPLSFGEHYVSGLTVYLSSNFCHVIGFVSHGPSDIVFGQALEMKHNHGIPFHLAFSPGEYLSSVWLHLEPRSVGKDRGMIVVRFIFAIDRIETASNFVESTACHKPRPSSLRRHSPIPQTEETRQICMGSSQRWESIEDSWAGHERARICSSCRHPRHSKLRRISGRVTSTRR